jgi:hypothetical protein
MFVSTNTGSTAVVAIDVLSAIRTGRIDRADRMRGELQVFLLFVDVSCIFEYDHDGSDARRDVGGNLHCQHMVCADSSGGGYGTHDDFLHNSEGPE